MAARKEARCVRVVEEVVVVRLGNSWTDNHGNDICCVCLFACLALGQGSFGKVYECINRTTGETNAVKQVCLVTTRLSQCRPCCPL